MKTTISAIALACLAMEEERLRINDRVGFLLRQYAAKRMEQEKLQSDMDSIADEIRDLMGKHEALEDFRGVVKSNGLYSINGGKAA
ncbi:MAG: hypothetical protein KGL39_11150 [Patescibacteria group bacterium]|nr:hypothetical protein [Patescibacteria group bacterium]